MFVTVPKESGRELARRVVMVVGVVALACLLTVVSAPSALASWGIHKSIRIEGGAAPVGVATDETGNIYVSIFSGQNLKFNLAGERVPPTPFGSSASALQSGVAVNPISHNVYVVNAETQTVEAYNSTTGALEHSFAIPGTGNIFELTFVQIAADSHGNVYVPDAPANKVEVFNEEGNAPEGGVVSEITGSGVDALKAPEGVAVGPAGNVWVADTGDGRVEEFEPDGTFVTEIASPHVQAVAVDGAGDVFASIGGEGVEPDVIEYSPAGTVIATFGKGVLKENPFGISDGIAVDDAHEILYVANNAEAAVQRFISWTDSTGPATGVAEAQATLHGTVEVESGTSVPSCTFEYGPTTAYGSSVPCSPGGPYTADISVSAALSGLTPGVDYHYRVSATNAGGFTQVGEDQVFGPPAVESESAEATVSTATLRAHITLVEAGESRCKEAQYVPEAEYATSGFAHAHSLPCTPPIGDTPGEYSVESPTIEGLPPNSIYHYRFLAESHAGTLTGPDEEFSTFGIVPGSFSFAAFSEGGEPFTQAGGHPYDLTDTFRLNTSAQKSATTGKANPLATDANPKDVVTELPPGVIGNPDATPKCEPYDVAHADCSGATQVGIMEVYTANPGATLEGKLNGEIPVPIYNLVPPKGLAAQFGARFNGFVTVHIDSRVRTGGDYGVTAEVINSSAGEGVVVPEVTLWGVPAAESHDPDRYCPEPPAGINEVAPCTERGPLIPFLSNPTACTGQREARMTVEPWQEDEPRVVVGASDKMPAITGCGRLGFKPSMTVTPTSKASDSASGLDVELRVPQNEDPNGLATADLKDAKVVLPEGVTVNPSSANGKVGCPLLTGKEGHPGQSGIDLENGEGADCPDASKVGTVRIKTPLLEEELTGGVYVAQQNANPFKSLLALYIVAEAPERGVVVKLAGDVELNPTTGQLTTTFDEDPQLPFETLKLDFFGGERAPLATPRTCGSYQPAALLEPFSHQGAEGEEGTPNAEPYIDPFEITSGPGGSACGSSPFAPSFTAGAEGNQAGSYSPFVLTLTRKDGEQRLSTVSLKMPLGLAGMIAKVTPCGNAQAEAGDCAASSQIGHVTAEAGVGDEPVVLPQAGKPEDPVYLTEKYDGAPFGLSIVVPAEAGPFNLGRVVVRSKIEVDSHTGQVSVVSNPIPRILQGVPLDVKAIHVDVDRPQFIFNPTSCQPMAVSGTIGSAEGASSAVSSRFQAAGCRGLAFEPKFSSAIHAKHSKRAGEYLHVAVTSTFGQANIAKVHVTLPGKLPSRLETLKLACTEAQYAQDPAGCPAGSFVGTATAHTPVLPVPLTGPAIFVSHGGAGFPNLDLVLQGDGVTIELVGNTFINKQSVTSSTFASVPDVPVSRFDLVLPAGPHSALSGNGNMCSKPLYMPTTITGQNGAVETQRTTVKVEGCKPEILVVGHSVGGTRADIHVHVPSAGTLTALGSGVTGVHRRVHAGNESVTVTLSKREESLLSLHPGRQLKVRVHLRFVPRHGAAISTSVVLLMG
jgi:streptogramin lyase